MMKEGDYDSSDDDNDPNYSESPSSMSSSECSSEEEPTVPSEKEGTNLCKKIKTNIKMSKDTEKDLTKVFQFEHNHEEEEEEEEEEEQQLDTSEIGTYHSNLMGIIHRNCIFCLQPADIKTKRHMHKLNSTQGEYDIFAHTFFNRVLRRESLFSSLKYIYCWKGNRMLFQMIII